MLIVGGDQLYLFTLQRKKQVEIIRIIINISPQQHSNYDLPFDFRLFLYFIFRYKKKTVIC